MPYLHRQIHQHQYIQKMMKRILCLLICLWCSQLPDIAAAMYDIPAFEKYREKTGRLRDTIMTGPMQKRIADPEHKYDLERKEYKIKPLTKEQQLQALYIQQKHTLHFIIACLIVTTLALLLLLYRNYFQKQQLQLQRIGELERKHQLLATEAVLQGEEQERARLARDLHDGVGSMLSGIKYSFRHVKRSLTMSSESHKAFSCSMDILDNCIKELRRVAHNMMPESLINFGLDAALKDFCKDIGSSGALHITYQSVSLEEERIDQTMAITIFRIVQELVNNTLTHAGARTMIVQLTGMEDHIAITAKDDGKGFTSVGPEWGDGIGWSNIRSRIEYLKGKADVQSTSGQGVTIHIELPLKRAQAFFP